MKTFLKIDYYGQCFLFLMMVGLLFFFPLSMLFLFILGIWQLLSSVLFSIFHKKIDRKQHLLKSLGYLTILSGVTIMGNEFELFRNLGDIGLFAFFLFWILVPLGIGVWYFTMVRKDFKKYCVVEKNIPSDGLAMNSPMEKVVLPNKMVE
ncbi:MAG: hypothetical protein AAF960_09405 [Bacteroidota bacterium]